MNSSNQSINHLIEGHYTRECGQQRIEDVIAQLDRIKLEVQRYAGRYTEAQDDAERAKVLNWTIHHITTNLMSNIRIDLLADSQAQLTKIKSV